MDDQLKQYLLSRYAGQQYPSNDGANETELMANMGRAGAQLGAAIAGASTPETPVFDQMSNQAAQQRKATQEYLMKKFASEQKVERPQAPKMMTDLIEKDGKLYSVEKGIDEATGAVIWQNAPKPATKEQLQQKELGLKHQETTSRLEEMKASRDLREEQKNREKVAKVQEKFTKAGVPNAESQLGSVQGMLAKYAGKDIPGFGRLQSAVPNMVVPDEWQSNRQTVEALASQIRNMKYGSAQSRQESENFLKEIGTGAGMSQERVIQGVQSIQRLIDENKKAILQSDPKASKAYLENEPEASQLMQQSKAPESAAQVGQGMTLEQKKARIRELQSKGGK